MPIRKSIGRDAAQGEDVFTGTARAEVLRVFFLAFELKERTGESKVSFEGFCYERPRRGSEKVSFKVFCPKRPR